MIFIFFFTLFMYQTITYIWRSFEKNQLHLLINILLAKETSTISFLKSQEMYVIYLSDCMYYQSINKPKTHVTKNQKVCSRMIKIINANINTLDHLNHLRKPEKPFTFIDSNTSFYRINLAYFKHIIDKHFTRLNYFVKKAFSLTRKTLSGNIFLKLYKNNLIKK